MKILIIEAQRYSRELIEDAVKTIFSRYFSDFIYEIDCDVVQSYSAAKEFFSYGNYDIVLLDNRIPFEDTGNMEFENLRRFSDLLRDIGYDLIPIFKSTGAIIIGTSLIKSKAKIKPDFIINKLNVIEDLNKIIKIIKKENKNLTCNNC